MSRVPDFEKMSVAEQIRFGLKQSISQAKGEMTLRTTALPKPVPPISSVRVAKIRKKLDMSQALFAGFLNVPKKTLQSWEQGTRVPKAGEARLLQLIDRDPKTILQLVYQSTAK